MCLWLEKKKCKQQSASESFDIAQHIIIDNKTTTQKKDTTGTSLVRLYLFRGHKLRHAVSVTQQRELVQPLELDPSTEFHFSAGICLSKLTARVTPLGERVYMLD